MSAKSPIDGMLYAITAVVRTPMAIEGFIESFKGGGSTNPEQPQV
jgi:hypothetical protein